MVSIDFLSKILNLLSADEEVKSFFFDKINWAASRKIDWESDKIRVGVIGVTSSGKSTLINALLGRDILSSAIAPSSGQLVCCSYGPKLFAKIDFDDDADSIVLKDKKFTSKNLMEFSDERLNAKNQKRVKSIEIQSPDFDLDKEILLIDSPGLDAYGLEIHEKLTLETLVPTIDVCIYVTTMKANSDEKAREILNVVARYGCPLIIVQNMLDTVQPSPSGDKSKEEVARDHYTRVQRIVDRSDVTNKEDVVIVQLSAEYARRWRINKFGAEKNNVTPKEFEESHYSEFVGVVNDFIERQKPEIEKQRIISLENVIQEVQNEISAKTTGKVPDIIREIDYSKSRNNIITIKDNAEREFDKAKKIGEERCETIISGIKEADKDTIEIRLNETNQFVTEIGSYIHKIIEESNRKLSEVASDLSIPVRDVLKDPVFNTFRDIAIEKKVEQGTIQVKKKGLGGWLARGLGRIFRNDDWGYDEKPTEEIVTDVKKSQKKMLQRLEESMVRYEDIYEKWFEGSLEKTCEKLLKEIESSENAQKARKEAAVQRDKLIALNNRISSLKGELQECKKALHIVSPQRKGQHKTEAKNKTIEVDDYFQKIVELARFAGRNQHREVIRNYIEKKGLSESDAVIIGWDENCINVFKWQTGISDATVFRLPREVIKIKKERTPKCYFILVNAIQIGAAEKQIRELNLEKYISGNDHIFWVIQDFSELINGDRIKEGLQGMYDLQAGYLTEIPSDIWIIHDNPLYNISLIEYQQRGRKMTLAEENELIAELKAHYRSLCTDKVISNISKIIR